MAASTKFSVYPGCNIVLVYTTTNIENKINPKINTAFCNLLSLEAKNMTNKLEIIKPIRAAKSIIIIHDKSTPIAANINAKMVIAMNIDIAPYNALLIILTDAAILALCNIPPITTANTVNIIILSQIGIGTNDNISIRPNVRRKYTIKDCFVTLLNVLLFLNA